IFQQYAVKYVGVSRGIPLSNSNQLWGLLWGAVAFGEWRTWGHSAVLTAVYGSLLMAAGLVAISMSVAGQSEHAKWREAAQRESSRYGIDARFISSALEGKSATPQQARRWFDWLLLGLATAVFAATGFIARWPAMTLHWTPAYMLITVGVIVFAAATISLWKVTKFN